MVRRTTKIEDPTKCQITYCKRKGSILRKCNEISVFCDIDLALVAFSPCGRPSKYSSRKNMEDILERYLELPPDKRYFYLNDVQVEKLEELNHIRGDENKLFYLDNQIKHLELEIQKATVEREIVNNKLKYFELGEDEEATVSKLTLFETNLNAALELIQERRNQLIPTTTLPSNFNLQIAQMIKTRIPNSIQNRVRDWPNQFRAKGGVIKYQDLCGQANRTLAGTSNGSTGKLLAAATFPSGGCLGFNFPALLETQFPPANHSSVQNELIIANQAIRSTPNPQLEGTLVGNSFVGNMGHGAPIWSQNYLTPQSSYLKNTLNNQNTELPTSQLRVNHNQVKWPWTPNGTYNNMPQNPDVNNVTLPSGSNPRILSTAGYQPVMAPFTATNNANNRGSYGQQFTNNFTTAASTVPEAAMVTANVTGGSYNVGSKEFPIDVDSPLANCSLDAILSDFNFSKNQRNMGHGASNWTPNGSINITTQKPNVNNITLPSSSDSWTLSVDDYEIDIPTFITTNSSTTDAVVTVRNQTTGNNNAGSEPDLSEVNLSPESFTIPNDHNLPDNQVGNEGKQEVNPFGLYEFQWGDGMDFEDLATFLKY